MPLPVLLIPLAVAGGSAIAQAVAKLKSHAYLNALREEWEGMEASHKDGMRRQYDRQVALCAQLGRSEPELPLVLRESEQVEEEETPPLWRRVLLKAFRRRRRTVADGSPHSRFSIIARHGGSFAAGAVWRVASAPVLNLARPLLVRMMTFLPRTLTILPRFAAMGGGAGGSIAASTGLRFAIGAFNAVGILLGPLMAGFAIYNEIKNIRRARRELEELRALRRAELIAYSSQTRRLQLELAATQSAEPALAQAAPKNGVQAGASSNGAHPAKEAPQAASVT